MKRSSFGFLFFFVLVLFMEGRALAFYCGSRLVSVGDSKGEVAARCGKPASKEGRPSGKGEEWIYDFGPESLIQILTFKGGKLTEIKTGGYGSDRNAIADFGCERAIVSVGDTKEEVLTKCGKPTSREVIGKKDRGAKGNQKVEKWTYNLGPSRFIRFYRFENGKLAAIETGGYGK
jgi:hypothetical protein